MTNGIDDGSRQPVAQPGTASPTGEPASDLNDKPITAAEFERRMADLKKSLESHTQGLVDKNLRRVDKGVGDVLKKVDELVVLARSSGVEIDDDKVQTMKDRATLQALQTPPASSDPTDKPLVQGADQQEPTDPVAGAALAIMRKRGVFVEESDPEISVVDRQTTDPKEFLDSVVRAIDAKVARMSKPLGEPAAMPGMIGQGAPSSSNDLQTQYEKELEKIAQGDIDGVFQLKIKYRQKGLQI